MNKKCAETVLELAIAPEPSCGADRHPYFRPADDIPVNGSLVGASERLDGIVYGVLAGTDNDGRPLVDFPANPSPAPLPARTLMVLGQGDLGREVALLFESGHVRKPLVVGLLQDCQPARLAGNAARPEPRTVGVQADGEKLVITAEKEIVLRCGEASITLTRAGKVLIRGTDLVSRSSGTNRIKGGSVHIN